MWRQWSASQIAERHKLLDRCLHHDPVLRDIHRLYQLLDGKSAALFSHVSIMIAACTFLAGSPTDTYPIEKIIFLVSTVIYLLIAITLLRVLDFNMYDLSIPKFDREKFYTKNSSDIYDTEADSIFGEIREFFAEAVKRRGIAHKRALGWTRTLTKSVVALVLADIVLRLWDTPNVLPALNRFLAAYS